jgi:nitroimidazol reductase NimA-like FMN-containing flavoprotein (pyridoxamine 5'-phosphate oxidase superfamily)
LDQRAPDRTRVKREPHRGRYDRETIDAILDEALVSHLGFGVDGQPFVIPTLHARVGDLVYVHGSAASRREALTSAR